MRTVIFFFFLSHRCRVGSMLLISSWPGLNSGGVGFYLTCALDAWGRIIPRDPWGKVATWMGIDEWRRYNEQTWKHVQQTFTWKFSPILSGFELFGMTETPSSTRNLSRTWAGDLLYRFDTSSTVGWEMRFGISFLQKNIHSLLQNRKHPNYIDLSDRSRTSFKNQLGSEYFRAFNTKFDPGQLRKTFSDRGKARTRCEFIITRRQTALVWNAF